jgi:hypothetical protein
MQVKKEGGTDRPAVVTEVAPSLGERAMRENGAAPDGFRMIGAAFPGGGLCWNVGGPARSGSSSLSCPRRTAAWLWHGGACCCSAAFCPRCFRSRWASWSRPSNGAIRSHPLSPNPNRHRSVVSLNSDMSITLFLWRCQDPGELLPATNYIKLPIQFSIRSRITRL